MSANEPFSASCRFCQRDLKCRGNEVPRFSLLNIVKNKDLVQFW